MAGDRSTSHNANAASTGRAVILLAVAVVLGVALLHALDNTPTRATRVATATNTQEAAPPASSVTPTTLQARMPADVKVLVANGIGVSGVASKVAGRLQPIGYQLLKPGNTVNKETNSLVEYAAGYQAEAQAVATSLGLPAAGVEALPAQSPVTDLQGANVLVIVGNDLANAPQTQAAQPQASGTAQGSTQAGATTGQSAAVTSTVVNPAVNGPLNHLPGVSPNPPASSGVVTH